MPRTIEERLQEVRSRLKPYEGTTGLAQVQVTLLVDALLADFRAEGIAHRTIRDSAMDSARKA